MRRYIKDTAGNMRLGKIAALTPQKRQCKFGSYYPARTFVKPPPRKAAGTLNAILGSAVRLGSEKNRALLTIIAKLKKK